MVDGKKKVPAADSKWAKQAKEQAQVNPVEKAPAPPPPDPKDDPTDGAEAELKAAKARLKQGELPGMETKKDGKLEDLIEAYDAAKRKRMKALETEVTLKGQLLQYMVEKKLSRYKRDEYEAEVKAGKQDVKARVKEEEDSEKDSD